jgi:hypothetical protein
MVGRSPFCASPVQKGNPTAMATIFPNDFQNNIHPLTYLEPRHLPDEPLFKVPPPIDWGRKLKWLKQSFPLDQD